MSLWKIGADDVSEEAQQAKDKLASKDGQIAAQRTQLMRQAQELEEIKASLNEALHKLAQESERALHLENQLIQREEDFRGERINTRNIQTSLDAAHNKLKAKEFELRDLEAALERLSRTSDDHNTRSTKLEREKATLEARIRELESNVRQLQSAAAAGTRRVVSRSSSSQFNDLKTAALEKQLIEMQEKMVVKDNELETLQQRLSHAQQEVLRFDNEKFATETKVKSHLEQLQMLLQEKEEELIFYRNQIGDGGRETELLQRIEEDEAKIGALEALLRHSEDSKGLEENLRNVEQRLKSELDKVSELELRSVGLIREKQDALNELEAAQEHLRALENEKRRQIDGPMQECSHLVSATNEQDIDALYTTTDVNNTDPSVIAYVEKLLRAIDRLRGERNDLRRSLQFLETEHKFAIDALEKRSEEGPSAASTTSDCGHIMTSPSCLPEADSLHTQLVHLQGDVESKCGEIRRLAFSAATYAILLRHSQAQLEQHNQLLSNSLVREEVQTRKSSALEEEVHHISRQLKQSDEKLKDLGARLEATVLSLEGVTDERDDLVSQLEVKDMEREEMRASRKCLQDRLEGIEDHLGEVSRTLEDVESDRDSLALQVANLTVDLKAAQDELADAESRYSTLQFHQLSSMSSSEATYALREQITDLEARVVRRTEQIGIHQHDIRRLETNLRLQEERLGEMTSELEILAAQKDAMVEDCADAREARDEALSRVDALEVELESLESKLTDNDSTLTSLICILVDTGARSKSYARALQQSQSRVVELEAQFDDLQTVHDALEADLADAQGSTTEDTRQMVIALATTQLQFNKIVARLQSLADDRRSLAKDLAVAQQQAEEQENTNRRLVEECATLRHGSSVSVTELATRSSEYQAEIDQLKKLVSENRTGNGNSRQQITSLTAELQSVQAEKKDLLVELEGVESSLAQTQMELEGLRGQFSAMKMTLEEREGQTQLEQGEMEALSKAQTHIEELEKRMDALIEELSQLHSSQNSLKEERDKGLRDLESLRAQLESLSIEKAISEGTRSDLAAANERLCEEISRLQTEQESIKSQTDQAMEAKNTELRIKLDELTHSLESSTQEAQRLSQELEQERQQLQDNSNRHATEMQLLAHERETTHSKLSALQSDMAVLRSTIEQNEANLVAHEEEKGRLQENITALEAQIQKSLSYALSLERQVQDGERVVETVRKQLNTTQLELSRAETSAKTAEMNLSLQSAQLKRELGQLQDKLAALESRPGLEETLANLEERNNEMEELLRAKCAEIEENDDHALEMLKENKKLSSKVEMLTRKVQNLQTKLAAAKATAVNPNPPSEQAPALPKPTPKQLTDPADVQTKTARRRSLRLSTGTSSSLPAERTPSMSHSKPSTSRAVSGPPTLRSKTPEKRQTPVFRLRTPEQPRVQERTPEPPSSVVGVKRRAPDDFEACESVPPQGFTAESIPSKETEATTPRVRRMLSSLQSGFTPTRSKILSSPTRQVTVSTPLIQDVTNSPRATGLLDSSQSAKQSKRSWLGKIRGATSQTAVRSTNRPVFTFMGETR